MLGLAGMPSQFVVVLRGEQAVIKRTAVFTIILIPGEVEIGYRLHPDYWNRGLITEAARAVRRMTPFADFR